MYTALYRAYRPEVFDEILGQEHIIRILKNQIDTESTSHAYLFCGTRGTGKTTTARILAKGLNCLSEGGRPCGVCDACKAIKEGIYLDVVEIDAASNNGVDNIRELRESVKYPPAVGRKKVYIIDEVHMLSTGAFNALLKTLEEPPEYVVFILATTEPQKLPATIMSRCMRLDFKRVPEKTLVGGMAEICNNRGINISEDALHIIAANADGSVRDGLSILDQCISGGDSEISSKDILDFLGASGEETFVELTDFVRRGRTADALVLLENALSDGKDVRQFMRDWVNHYRNLLMTKFIRDPQGVINMSVENIDRIRKQSNSIDLEDINRGILEISRTMNEAKWSTQPRILLELAIVTLSSNIYEINQDTRMQVAQRKQVAQSQLIAKSQPSQELQVDEYDRSKTESNGDLDTVNTDASRKDNDVNLDEIWESFYKAGEMEQGSFYIIANNGRLTEFEDTHFTIEIATQPAMNYAEKNRQLMEEIMERQTGKRRHMELRAVGESVVKSGEKSVSEIAKDAGSLLGIDIEIQ